MKEQINKDILTVKSVNECDGENTITESSEKGAVEMEEEGKDFKEENLKEDMVKVRVWVSGHYYWKNGKRIHVKGHYKIIDAPKWKRERFGRR